MYHYIKSHFYDEVISLKSLEIRVISGFLISLLTIMVGTINTPVGGSNHFGVTIGYIF